MSEVSLIFNSSKFIKIKYNKLAPIFVEQLPQRFPNAIITRKSKVVIYKIYIYIYINRERERERERDTNTDIYFHHNRNVLNFYICCIYFVQANVPVYVFMLL